MHPDSMLLVLPVPLRWSGDRLLLESQACNGVRRWADNFERLILAAPAMRPADEHCEPFSGTWSDTADHTCGGRVEFVPLPWAHRSGAFVRNFGPTRRRLAALVARSRYLQFAIGGFIGDWGAVAALEAHRQGRPFAIHSDRVEGHIPSHTFRSVGLKRRLKLYVFASAARQWYRWILRRCRLGLLHGRDCYSAYVPYCRNSHVIHDVHTSPADVLPPGRVTEKAVRAATGGPLRIVYAGRAADLKAPLDWIRAVGRARELGADVRATWLGEGPLLADMHALAAELGVSRYVSLPGFVGDREAVLEALRAADIMLFTHVTPESPRCLIEALISATPIVGYGSDYPEDLVAGTGGGRFVPMGAWERLGGLIAELCRDRAGLARLIRSAAATGARFNDDAVFRERSELIKKHLG